MLTDKQSLYLCGFIIIGFLAAGILGILDSYLVVGILSLAFLAVIVNIFIVNPFKDEEEDYIETSDSLEEE